MSYKEMTAAYYAQWTDVPAAEWNRNAFIPVCSEKRNTVQKGYGKAFDLVYFSNRIAGIASYNEKTAAYIPLIAPLMSVTAVKNVLEQHFTGTINHSIKYYFDTVPSDIDTSAVKILTKEDYRFFSAFYCTHNTCAEPSWLKDYFDAVVGKGYFHGIFDGNNLVSVTDSPDMPYMEDTVAEIGVNTLADYRKRGYAKSVCASCVKHIIGTGKTPLWSCSNTNTVSQRLAKRIGFRYFADMLTGQLHENEV